MQKKSFLIKDILQKLNEDDSAKRSPPQNGGKLEENLKKLPSIDSSRLLYDWHSLAMAAAVSQQQQQNGKFSRFFNWQFDEDHIIIDDLSN